MPPGQVYVRPNVHPMPHFTSQVFDEVLLGKLYTTRPYTFLSQVSLWASTFSVRHLTPNRLEQLHFSPCLGENIIACTGAFIHHESAGPSISLILSIQPFNFLVEKSPKWVVRIEI